MEQTLPRSLNPALPTNELKPFFGPSWYLQVDPQSAQLMQCRRLVAVLRAQPTLHAQLEPKSLVESKLQHFLTTFRRMQLDCHVTQILCRPRQKQWLVADTNYWTASMPWRGYKKAVVLKLAALTADNNSAKWGRIPPVEHKKVCTGVCTCGVKHRKADALIKPGCITNGSVICPGRFTMRHS